MLLCFAPMCRFATAAAAASPLIRPVVVDVVGAVATKNKRHTHKEARMHRAPHKWNSAGLSLGRVG